MKDCDLCKLKIKTNVYMECDYFIILIYIDKKQRKIPDHLHWHARHK
jgi:hypothetical protein